MGMPCCVKTAPAQFHGSSCATRLTGCSAIRSTQPGFLIEAVNRVVAISEALAAARLAEEPDAGKLHVRVCEGWGRQRPAYPAGGLDRQGCCRVAHRSRCSRPRAARR